MRLAAKAMIKRSSGAPMKVSGSIGRTLNNKLAMKRVSITAAPTPMTAPQSASRVASESTSRRTSAGRGVPDKLPTACQYWRRGKYNHLPVESESRDENVSRGATYAGIRHAIPALALLSILGGVAIDTALLSSAKPLKILVAVGLVGVLLALIVVRQLKPEPKTRAIQLG